MLIWVFFVWFHHEKLKRALLVVYVQCDEKAKEDRVVSDEIQNNPWIYEVILIRDINGEIEKDNSIIGTS